MPSLKDLKNRIGSVKNTRKITKAMQMVAAATVQLPEGCPLPSLKQDAPASVPVVTALIPIATGSMMLTRRAPM